LSVLHAALLLCRAHGGVPATLASLRCWSLATGRARLGPLSVDCQPSPDVDHSCGCLRSSAAETRARHVLPPAHRPPRAASGARGRPRRAEARGGKAAMAAVTSSADGQVYPDGTRALNGLDRARADGAVDALGGPRGCGT